MNGKIDMYTNTQLRATSQNGKLKSLRSDHWNLSSADSAAVLPSFFEAYPSIKTNITPANNEKMQIAVPTHIVELIKPSSELISLGVTIPPNTDAKRATVRFKPSANPSSLPANH